MQKRTLAFVVPAVLALAHLHAAKANAADQDGRIYYKDGLKLEAADTDMKLNVLLQPRYEYTDIDGENRGISVDDTSGFRMRRARFIVSGNVLDKQFSYTLNNDFASDTGGGDLKDAWLQWNGKSTNLRGGRFKVPLTRQTLVSSQNLFFADRSVNDDFFTADRDVGAMAHGMIGETGHYFAGVFNGDTDGEFEKQAPVDNNINGIVSVDFSTAQYGSRNMEGDLRDKDDFGATAGAAVLYGQGETAFGDGDPASNSDFDQIRLNGDVGVRCHGADIQAEVSYRSIDVDFAEDSVDQVGFYLQATQMLDKNWGFGARYGMYDPDSEETDSVSEYTLGLDYFISGHRLKLQNQATWEVESPDGDGDDITDFKYVLQLQAYI